MNKKVLIVGAVALIIVVAIVLALSGINKKAEEPHVHFYGHSEVILKEPSCAYAGEKVRYCECGYASVTYIDELNHTEVVDAAVAPTCEATGLTEGKHCSVCNKVLVAQETVATTGHDYDVESLENEGKVGSKVTYKCSNCRDTYDEIVEPLNVSVKLTNSSQATMGSFGTWWKYYEVTASGGYGSKLYKFEVFTSNTATEPLSHLTTDFSDNNAYGFEYNGQESLISGWILRVTVKDEAGNECVYDHIMFN